MFRRVLQAARQQRFAAGASGFALGSMALSGIAYAQAPNRIDAKDIDVEVTPLTETDASATKQKGERRAYDPETGEIDWDCPCLGGMAHGPCGEEFKEAFSCFVYSKSEIKGSECIPKFELMRNCFKKYPEVYADFQDDPADDDAIESKNTKNETKPAPEAKDVEKNASGAKDVEKNASDAKDVEKSAPVKSVPNSKSDPAETEKIRIETVVEIDPIEVEVETVSTKE